jgi:hypothetical protein
MSVFMCNLFKDAFSVTQDYITSNKRAISELWNGKDLEGSGHGLVLRYYFLKGLRKPRDSKDSRSPGRDLNPSRPEYEAGVSTTQPLRSVVPMSLNKDVSVFVHMY